MSTLSWAPSSRRPHTTSSHDTSTLTGTSMMETKPAAPATSRAASAVHVAGDIASRGEAAADSVSALPAMQRPLAAARQQIMRRRGRQDYRFQPMEFDAFCRANAVIEVEQFPKTEFAKHFGSQTSGPVDDQNLRGALKQAHLFAGEVFRKQPLESLRPGIIT